MHVSNGARLPVAAGVVSAVVGLSMVACSETTSDNGVNETRVPKSENNGNSQAANIMITRGRYLATIGACEACHTPPEVPQNPPDPSDKKQIARERNFRTDPDWVKYLDHDRPNAGGVPFVIRLSKDSNAVVYSRNITPDNETGIGSWSEDDIVKALRTGVTKNGRVLFMFPPHSFYPNLADDDAYALARYLKSLKPVRHEIPDRVLPFDPQPAKSDPPEKAPSSRDPKRADYLLSALVGCTECHSHHEGGTLKKFVGGDPKDATTGVFRFGPDLPLRVHERGLATFPYPGYAVFYADNLTKFGVGGPQSKTSVKKIMRAFREGVSPEPDEYGRPSPLNHIMLWQFYSRMSDDDSYAIARLIKKLRYEPHEVPRSPIYFGEDWRAAFEQVFGEPPSGNDAKIFGKNP
ncbi:hypothetical protein ACNF49_39375 [Actinomadura sp. ATCC 39365]